MAFARGVWEGEYVVGGATGVTPSKRSPAQCPSWLPACSLPRRPERSAFVRERRSTGRASSKEASRRRSE